MNKKMRIVVSVVLSLTMVITASVFSFGETATAKATSSLKDGTYTAVCDTDTDGTGKMFFIAKADNKTCKLSVVKGVMTATVRLNSTGYDKLYLGTAEEAAKADTSSYINYVADADGLYTFAVPVAKLNTITKIAAYGTRGKAWHDHSIVFNYYTPGKTSISKLKAGKKSVKATWKKQTGDTTGYQIQYSTKSSFSGAKTVNISKNTSVSKTIKSLKSKKKYYFRIRTYKETGISYTDENSNTVNRVFYSAWSSKKSVKVK